MSEYLIKKISSRIDSLSKQDHQIIKESLADISYSLPDSVLRKNLAKLNLDLENYIINVIDVIDDVKKLLIKIEKNKIN